MFIGTINVYHFVLLSLTLPGGHKVSTEQNLLASFFFFLFFLGGGGGVAHFSTSLWNWCNVEAIQAEHASTTVE